MSSMNNRISFLAKSNGNGQFEVWVLKGSFPNQTRIDVKPDVFTTLIEANAYACVLQKLHDSTPAL